MNFRNPQQLGDWLSENKIDTSQWGIGTAKSIANLWHEVMSGDSELSHEPLVRKVQVATLHVYQNVSQKDPYQQDGPSKNRQLIEAVQTFDDGRKRARNRPPSEKIKRGETAQAAALRCLHEEVGCTQENILSAPRLLQTETIHRDSPSYPTLASEFTIHTLEVNVIGLPSDNFSTTNLADDDPVCLIEWCWRV